MITASRSAASMTGALALALAFAFVMQAPAFAQTYNHTDPPRDVAKVSQGDRAPRYGKADVTHLRIVHSDNAIRLSIRLRSAGLRNVRFRVVGFALRTSGHSYSGDFVRAHGSVQYDLFDETAGKSVTCDETSGGRDSTIWVKLDRSCVNKPRWIRASVNVATYKGTQTWEDNALSGKWRRSDDSVFSPPIHAPT